MPDMAVREWERLQEALWHLEHARREEQRLRKANEALIAGLSALAGAQTRAEALQALRLTLQRLTACEDCWLLFLRNGALHDEEHGLHFPIAQAFARVLAGEVLNAFDVRCIPEWRGIDAGVRAALHLPLRMAPEEKGMLVLISSQPAAFSQETARIAYQAVPFCEQVMARIEDIERRQAKRLQSILDRLPAAIWLTDEAGRVRFVNRTARRWLGDAPQIGNSSGKCALRCRDGIERVFECACIEDEGQRIHMALDVSERERHEREKAEMQRKLLQIQRLESLGVLAGGIAHDFNNLLAAIMGHADLARADATERPFLVTKHLDRIVEASERAADLCRQLLAYAGGGKLVVQRVDLSEIARKMTEILQVNLHKDVTLSLMLARDLPPVEADASQMQQVVMNLVTNANEAIGDRPGKITVRTGILRASEADLKQWFAADDAVPGKFVYLEVSDTGCGISRQTLERIFEPFFTTKFTGRGLGMSAVWGIVRSHRGAISIESEPGKGTSVRVMFPAMEEHAGKMDAQEHRAQQTQGPVVLIADDEPDVREMLRAMLTAAGVKEVLVAADGLEEEEIFRRAHERLSLVILDFLMPKRDGLSTLKVLKAIDASVPIAISSGYGEEMLANHGLKGADVLDVLPKPYRLADVRALLARVQPSR